MNDSDTRVNVKLADALLRLGRVDEAYHAYRTARHNEGIRACAGRARDAEDVELFLEARRTLGEEIPRAEVLDFAAVLLSAKKWRELAHLAIKVGTVLDRRCVGRIFEDAENFREALDMYQSARDESAAIALGDRCKEQGIYDVALLAYTYGVADGDRFRQIGQLVVDERYPHDELEKAALRRLMETCPHPILAELGAFALSKGWLSRAELLYEKAGQPMPKEDLLAFARRELQEGAWHIPEMRRACELAGEKLPVAELLAAADRHIREGWSNVLDILEEAGDADRLEEYARQCHDRADNTNTFLGEAFRAQMASGRPLPLELARDCGPRFANGESIDDAITCFVRTGDVESLTRLAEARLRSHRLDDARKCFAALVDLSTPGGDDGGKAPDGEAQAA